MSTRRKSAPRMACLPSATMNTQRKVWRRPRLSVRERSPKVVMLELLTAWSVMPVWEGGQCGLGGGITLTSAPMSARNCRLLVPSVTKTGDLVVLGQWRWSLSTTGRGVSRPGTRRGTLPGAFPKLVVISTQAGVSWGSGVGAACPGTVAGMVAEGGSCAARLRLWRGDLQGSDEVA